MVGSFLRGDKRFVLDGLGCLVMFNIFGKAVKVYVNGGRMWEGAEVQPVNDVGG